MNPNTRPLSVTLLARVYLVVGIVGVVYHFSELLTFRYDSVQVELMEIVAIVSGVFMLRGLNWARWLALAWITVHVILSAFHSFREFAIHCVFAVVIGWALFRPAAGRYFRYVTLENS